MCKSLYLDLLKKSLLDVIYEEETEAIKGGTCWPKRAFTMIGRKRLENLQYCVEDVIKNKVEGDLIETGVWRGGAVIFMQGILKAYNESRRVFVADSFKGLPEPDKDYPIDGNSTLHTVELLRVTADQVKNNFKKYDLLDSNVVFLEGWFKDTLMNADIEKIAVLRMDGDLYSSTWETLTALYHKVQSGGYVIVDDYSWVNCRTAIENFRKQYNIRDSMHIIDAWGAYWQKS
ncbi:MAG: TylF/MycF/NovP-related O-methyltransferase [Nitrosarchaeum sp.]|nr:TylF/MycF/NovP-related O-methyltransferase [Nitrosarchaeum sp.]